MDKYRQEINLYIATHSDTVVVHYPLVIRTLIQRHIGAEYTQVWWSKVLFAYVHNYIGIIESFSTGGSV